MARPKDHDVEAKVGFLFCSVEGTAWGLSAIQRAPAESSDQLYLNALYKFMR